MIFETTIFKRYKKRCSVALHQQLMVPITHESFSHPSQALVHVSQLMSTGKYHRLVGVVSQEVRNHVPRSGRLQVLDKLQLS